MPGRGPPARCPTGSRRGSRRRARGHSPCGRRRDRWRRAASRRTPGIIGRPAVGIHEPAVGRALLPVPFHADLALGDHAGREVVDHGGAVRARHGDRVRVGAEPLGRAGPAPRSGRTPRSPRSSPPAPPWRPSRRSPRGDPRARCWRAPPRRGGGRAFSMAICMPLRATTWPKPRPPSTRAIAGVSASTVTGDFGFTRPAFHGLRVLGHADDPVGIVAPEVGADEQSRDPGGVPSGRAQRGHDVGHDGLEPGRIDGGHVGYNTPAMKATKAEREFFDPAPLPWRPAPGFPTRRLGAGHQRRRGRGRDHAAAPLRSGLRERPRRDPRLLGGDLHHLGHARVRRPPLPGGLGGGAAARHAARAVPLRGGAA